MYAPSGEIRLAKYFASEMNVTAPVIQPTPFADSPSRRPLSASEKARPAGVSSVPIFEMTSYKCSRFSEVPAAKVVPKRTASGSNPMSQT
jgi:hypothetical protein